jgi:AhpD family alkylhydroperoxidase
LAQAIIPGAVERNRASSAQAMAADEGLDTAMLDVCFDAQTSGGLLVAVAEPAAGALLKRLHEEGMVEAASIGRVLSAGSGRVCVRTSRRRTLPMTNGDRFASSPTLAKQNQETSPMSCCSDAPQSGAPPAAQAGEASSIPQRFQEFLKAANAPGALDARTKQAIALALSVLAKCEPCLKIHLKKAKDMGFSAAEIDEAAWMAIAFGGSPTMMFYNGVKKNETG